MSRSRRPQRLCEECGIGLGPSVVECPLCHDRPGLGSLFLHAIGLLFGGGALAVICGWMAVGAAHAMGRGFAFMFLPMALGVVMVGAGLVELVRAIEAFQRGDMKAAPQLAHRLFDQLARELRES